MEIDKDLNVTGTNLYLPATDKNLIDVRNKFSNTHDIEAIIGVKVKLKKLKDNESIVFGDGKSYHFKLTKKQ